MSENSATACNSKPQKHRVQKPGGKKRPKKITETYLHNAGLYYLGRYASSSANFRDVMLRKVKRSCTAHPEQDYEHCAAMVERLTQKFTDLGLLDDATYTRAMVTSLRRQGKSARAIQIKLRSKGLPAEQIATALEKYDTENTNPDVDPEYQAAMTFARKKRIGPFSRTKANDPQKDLARLARAGFSYETSRIILSENLEKDHTEP